MLQYFCTVIIVDSFLHAQMISTPVFQLLIMSFAGIWFLYDNYLQKLMYALFYVLLYYGRLWFCNI